MTASLYQVEFYDNRRAQTAHTARAMLSALPGSLSSLNIADVGCGTGTFLATALAAGSSKAYGLEGDWVTPAMLDDPRIIFGQHDLEQTFALPRVDLALCLEVAEHLTPGRAESFIADLVAVAPAVLFSAAIPGQGGVGHLNEHWQSWWAERFAELGYAAFDLVRPAIWADPDVPAWYKQNAIVYLDRPTAQRLAIDPTEPGLLDRVHPAFWERANRELHYANALPESEILRRQAEENQ